MSFVTYRSAAGFGQMPDLSSISGGGAVGLATKAILTDPSLLGVSGLASSSTLSPFSVINLSMLEGALSTQLEAGIETVADAVIAALPNEVLTMVSTIVSDVMDIVPVIGPIFKTIFDALSMAFSGGGAAYVGSAQEQQDCQAFASYFKAPQSGGGLDPCTTCPSDIFLPSIPTSMTADNNYAVSIADTPPSGSMDPCGPGLPWGPEFCANFKQYAGVTAWNTAAGEMRPGAVNLAPRSFNELDFYRPGPNFEATYQWRSVLGQALMLATEGGVMDVLEIAPAQRAAYALWLNKNYDAVRQGFVAYLMTRGRMADATWWATYGGVPPARRAQFQALRRAIQYSAPQYAPTPADKRDAGVSLWPIYMDLLLNAYDLNQLNDEFVGYCLTYQLLLGSIYEGPAFGVSHKLAGYLAKSDGTAIDPHKATGLLMNRNLFGRGYAYYSVPSTGMWLDISVCAQNVASQISTLVTNWRHTVENTATLQGTRKLAAYAAQAKAMAVAASTYKARGPLMSVWAGPRATLLAPPVQVVKKAHGSAALMGAAAAAAAIYFFL